MFSFKQNTLLLSHTVDVELYHNWLVSSGLQIITACPHLQILVSPSSQCTSLHGRFYYAHLCTIDFTEYIFV